MTWLSPSDVQSVFHIGRTTAYNLIKAYIASGGRHIRKGKITRVPEKEFTEYMESK